MVPRVGYPLLLVKSVGYFRGEMGWHCKEPPVLLTVPEERSCAVGSSFIDKPADGDAGINDHLVLFPPADLRVGFLPDLTQVLVTFLSHPADDIRRRPVHAASGPNASGVFINAGQGFPPFS